VLKVNLGQCPAGEGSQARWREMRRRVNDGQAWVLGAVGAVGMTAIAVAGAYRRLKGREERRRGRKGDEGGGVDLLHCRSGVGERG
jgi:hypothetical protein